MEWTGGPKMSQRVSAPRPARQHLKFAAHDRRRDAGSSLRATVVSTASSLIGFSNE